LLIRNPGKQEIAASRLAEPPLLKLPRAKGGKKIMKEELRSVREEKREQRLFAGSINEKRDRAET
jgi:hypothetical protein